MHFAEVFNHTILRKDPIQPEELFPEDIRESAILQVTERGRITLTQYRDVVKCVKGAAYPIILGIENQESVNYQMPFRVMARDFINYARQIRVISDQHIKENREKKRDFNAKNSIVIYWGDEPWEGPRHLADMFGESKWASYAQDYGMYVLEVQKMTEEEILSYNDDLKLAFGCVRFSHQKKELVRFLTEHEKALANASSLARDVVSEVTGIKKVSEDIQRILSKDGGEETMLRGFQEMFAQERAEGRAEGLAEGLAEGIVKGRCEERENTERERLRAEKAEKELAQWKAMYEIV